MRGNAMMVVGFIFVAFVAVIFIGGVLVALKIITLPVLTLTSQVDSAGKIIDKTYDADNAINNYEWFKTQYQKILANRVQINNTKEQIAIFKETYGENASQWDYGTKEEWNRLQTIKLGLMNQEENLVADYNAKASMSNRNIFMDKLPLYVDRILW